MDSLKENTIKFLIFVTILILSVKCDIVSDGETITESNFSTTELENNLSLHSSQLSIGDPHNSIEDKVNLLSKQMTALLVRRREDYKLLENSLQKYVTKNSLQYTDSNLQTELNSLRHEVKLLSDGGLANKERLTVQWLTKSITEFRSELSELQESSNKITHDLQQKNQILDDISGLRSDFQSVRLQLEALRTRQETSEVAVKELRDELIQNAEDVQRSFDQMFTNQNQPLSTKSDIMKPVVSQHILDSSKTDDLQHKMRHQKFLHQQMHDLEKSQNLIKIQLREMKNMHSNDRLHNLEIEQKRLSSRSSNLTRQVTSLDKLHSSMLELLEDVEAVQNKVDKTVPDIIREVSKIEFKNAELAEQYSSLVAKEHTMGSSIKAMAITVSTLQRDREIIKQQQKDIETLKQQMFEIKSGTEFDRQRFLHDEDLMQIDVSSNGSNTSRYSTGTSESTEFKFARKLVEDLESVEMQYESIVNKLPKDCSQVSFTEGLYLIAPVGQHHPVLSKCNGKWTTIQRRYDGSVDFNRSWEDYSRGFGIPAGEFWIGNEILHHLTQTNCSKLKIVMQDIYDNTWLAEYNNFSIAAREDGYRLSISGYSGNASDAFDYQNRMQFSSIDEDRDISNTHCAANYEGGWWFSHCQHANLNGRYNLGLTWFDSSRNEWIAVKSSHIMVTQKEECQHSKVYSTSTLIKV